MMRRIVVPFIVVASALSVCGCTSLDWLRSVGHYPSIAPSDYAFYSYFGTSSQVFQGPVSQVQGAAIEALRDMGFREIGPAKPCPESTSDLQVAALTPDGRPTTITFTPQNRMTNMRLSIGVAHIGDEVLCRDVFRRVVRTSGQIPRDYLPLDTTIANRFNPDYPNLMAREGKKIEELKGEPFRATPGIPAASPEFTSPVTGTGSGVVPQPFDPERPAATTNYPMLPYPFSPYLPSYPLEQMNPYP